MVPRVSLPACFGGADRFGRFWQSGRAGAHRMRRRYRPAVVLAIAVAALLRAAVPASATVKFQADEWITECGGSPGGRAGDCSITVPFWQAGYAGKGSFALVVMLDTGNIGIVGQPLPVKAVLRVDGNPAIECRATQYCIFPSSQSRAIVRELGVGALILIDVFTRKSHFAFSLTPKGYQAGIAQIRAWGYPLPGD